VVGQDGEEMAVGRLGDDAIMALCRKPDSQQRNADVIRSVVPSFSYCGELRLACTAETHRPFISVQHIFTGQMIQVPAMSQNYYASVCKSTVFLGLQEVQNEVWIRLANHIER
jgi:hypothetical protein